MTKKSYSELKKALDECLQTLQDPNTDLDHAIELHAKGKALLAELELYLKDVELKIKSAKKAK